MKRSKTPTPPARPTPEARQATLDARIARAKVRARPEQQTDDPLRYLTELTRASAQYTATELATCARNGARDLSRLADKLERDGYMALINRLGELQTQGHRIDLLCARLGELQQVLETADDLIDEIDQPGEAPT